MPKWSILLSVALTLVTGLKAQQTAQSSTSSDVQVLQELLTEVRQLRLALERANSVNARLQITLQRTQLQQNQVNRISGELESLRSDIARSEAEQAQMSNHLPDLEGRLSQEQDPNRQKQMQAELKDTKERLEQQTRTIQDLRGRESELASSLQREQTKLNDLQSRLDSLEKLLEPQQAQ